MPSFSCSGPLRNISYEAKIIQVANWLGEEKTLKAAIKRKRAANTC